MQAIKTFTDKKLKGPVTAGLLLTALVLDLIVMFGRVASSGRSVWGTAEFWADGANFVPTACMFFVILFFAGLVSAAVGTVLSFRMVKTPWWPSAAVAGCNAVMLVLSTLFGVSSLGVLLLIAMIISALGIVYSHMCNLANGVVGGGSSGKTDTRLKKLLSVLSVASLVPVLSLFYIPLCSYKVAEATYSIVPMGMFSSGKDNIISLVLFVILFIAGIINVLKLVDGFRCLGDEVLFADKVRVLVNINTVVTGLYFMAALIFCSVNNSVGGDFTTVSYIPFLFMVAVAIVCAYCTRKILHKEVDLQKKAVRSARTEFFIYGGLSALVAVATAFSDIIRVTFINVPLMEDISLNGLDIFMNYNTLESGFQLIAFLVFVVVAVMAGLFVISLVSLVSGSKLFFKITLAELISGAFFSLLIGLFGKYYEIVQRLNADAIESIVKNYNSSMSFVLDYKVESQAFYWFFVALAVVIVAIVRKPYSRGTLGETPVLVGGGAIGGSAPYSGSVGGGQPTAEQGTADTDPCPAFTELDRKLPMLQAEANKRSSAAFQAPTLPGLVQFVVNYARDCRLHLSYTAEDIATFIAGLGATRLTILQGMSGTGKTSLPKIFSEAILGNCEIIEVESSWRDKNELLGYYNEFSKTYTPKKFTQALYKAALNPEAVTFIVLDEMNLSRIEYYFSDFLSLMENEEDKREIKLLNVGLHRTENGYAVGYAGLEDGHTVKIPANIWFIGTANRDESTFEISDKVYDRAHTMNFNKRAAKPLAYGDPIPQRYVSAKAFIELIEKAKASVRFDIDNYPLIREVEALLEPYNISFGNRIAKQIETFVSIYCSCFPAPETVAFDAVEKILLSKVVSKLEFKSVENKAQLAAEFEKRKLHRCSEFILKLNED